MNGSAAWWTYDDIIGLRTFLALVASLRKGEELVRRTFAPGEGLSAYLDAIVEYPGGTFFQR
jgi:hypothetical protein